MNTNSAAVDAQKTSRDIMLKRASKAVKGIMNRFAMNEPRAGLSSRKTGWRRWQGIALSVLLPLAVVSAYYLFWVSERYVSSTQIIVKENGSEPSMSSSLGFLVPGATSESQDAYLVVNYVHSLDMALYLNEALGLKDYYQSENYDLFSRLPADASQEDYLEYFREHVGVSFDEQTGIITISAQAFEPEFSQKQIEVITGRSEDFVNTISNQLAEKQVAFVRKELDRAQEKLRRSKEQILDFQNRNKVISPEAITQGISGIIQGMEARLADLRAKLTASKTYLNSGSSQVVSLQAEIAALEKQIEKEQVRLVGVSGSNDGERLNSLSAQFQNMELDLQFAMDAYQTALKSLEAARMEASNNLKHLMTVSAPSLPEEAQYPRKLYNLASLGVVLLLLYGIGKMLVASIRDHRI